MKQLRVKSNGKNYVVNIATNDDGIGAGFATGQLVMRSYGDNRWYIVTAEGSPGSVDVSISQSALPFTTTGSAYRQYDNSVQSSSAVTFFEQNYPYQILRCDNGLAYQVFITGTAPTAVIEVSQSALYSASVTLDNHAVIDRAKPYLLLQNITDGNYYYAYLWNNAGTIELAVNQTMVSQSWVKPIY